jgi:glutathione S-transferase
MKALSAPNDIILYNYEFSPFGKRITTYLAVRGIDYAICVCTHLLPHLTRGWRTDKSQQEQPFTMPRPDLKLLSIAYRRIPILAIGRDIYLDTRCQLRKLETLFPNNQMLDATNSQDLFVQQLLERYMVEGPVFRMAAGLMPVQEDMFRKDRKGFLGRSWGKEELDDGRGTCLAYIRGLFTLFEGTVLSDGREWVLGGEKLSLADIEGECVFSLTLVEFCQRQHLRCAVLAIQTDGC